MGIGIYRAAGRRVWDLEYDACDLVLGIWNFPTPSPGPAVLGSSGLLDQYIAGPPPPFDSGLRDEDPVVRGTLGRYSALAPSTRGCLLNPA